MTAASSISFTIHFC